MPTNPELEQLLQDRFDITTTDFVAALKFLPASRPWAASLTEDEARLLDDADFAEDRDAFVAAGTEIAGHRAHLAVTAFTADDVATGLGVSASRVRQKRLAGRAVGHSRRTDVGVSGAAVRDRQQRRSHPAGPWPRSGVQGPAGRSASRGGGRIPAHPATRSVSGSADDSRWSGCAMAATSTRRSPLPPTPTGTPRDSTPPRSSTDSQAARPRNPR